MKVIEFDKLKTLRKKGNYLCIIIIIINVGMWLDK